MEEESNGELAFLDTLLKRNDGKTSVFVYKYNTYTTALATKQVAKKVLFPPCLIQRIQLSLIMMT